MGAQKSQYDGIKAFIVPIGNLLFEQASEERLGLEACGVSSLMGKSQMKGHFAGHCRYMESRRGLVNEPYHSLVVRSST